MRLLLLLFIQSHCKKLVDFGCAEMKFFYTVKHILPTIEHLIEVDMDRALLIGSQNRVEPLVTDFMNRREFPLTVEVYCGSVSEKSSVLLGTDIVVAIELIEHLFAETLNDLPANVFGFMQPKVAVFTTPNVEINPIFPRLGQGFRHDDHKFEWTRKEFEDWASAICATYPRYSVKFYGIGPGPSGTEEMGCVSQMAVFIRSDLKRLMENADGASLVDEAKRDEDDSLGDYVLINKVKYPYDERTKEQVIVDEAKYHITQIERVQMQTEEYDGTVLIEISSILAEIQSLGTTFEVLRGLLVQNGFTVIDDKVKLQPLDSWSTSTEEGFQEDADFFEGNNENNQNAVNVGESHEEDWD